MNISFICNIDRVAILDPKLSGGKVIQVGVVEEYIRTDFDIKVNIRLNDDLPEEMLKGIQENPHVLRISEALSSPQNVMIIPSRPNLIV